MIEPIQGEGGIIVPDDGYLLKVRELCDKYNVLLIADEVQTGFGRTGKFMGSYWDLGEVKPDLIVLAKSMSGGVTPVSGIVGYDEAMLTLKPGDHGSTFGGNPLGMAVAKTAVEVMIEEGMVENAQKMGTYLKDKLSAI